MTRRRFALAAFVLAVLGVAAAATWAPGLIGRLVVSRVGAAVERETTLGVVRLHVLPPSLEIEDLRIAGLDPNGAPFVHVPRVLAVPRLTSLWGPRLVLEQLQLEGLVLRINAFPQGGDDIPKPRHKGGGGEVRIQRLTIAGGEFRLNHTRVPLQLDLPDVRGSLFGEGGGALRGGLAFGPGHLRFGTAPDLPVGTDMSLRLADGVLTVLSGRVLAEGTDIAYAGQVTLEARPQGMLSLEGPVDLAVLDHHVMRTEFAIHGQGRYQGRLEIDGSRLKLSGNLRGTRGEFDGIPVPRFAGGLGWDGDGVHIRGLEVEALGGRGVMDVEVPPSPSTATWSGTVRAVDADPTLRAIFDIGPTGLAGSATGGFALAWPRGSFRAGLDGRIAVDVEQRPGDARRPIAGRVEWRAERGVQFLDVADLRTATSRARLHGRIEVDDVADLDLALDSSDLADADQTLLRLRRALGTVEAGLAGVSGAGSFQGSWTRTLQNPLFAGRFTGTDLGWLGVVWGRAEWVGTLDPTEVRSRSLVVRRGDSELWLDGLTETGDYGLLDGVDARMRFTDWSARDFVTALGWDLDVDGPLTGEARITGRRSLPRGAVRLESAAGRYYGVAYAGLRARAELAGTESYGQGEAEVGGGRVRFEGSLSDDALFDGHASAEDVALDGVLPSAAPGLEWGGRVSGEGWLSGPLGRPRLYGRLTSPRVFFGDEGVGALEATVEADGDGQVRVAATCRSPRVDALVSGSLGVAPPYEASVRVAVDDTSLDPFVRAMRPGLPAGVGLVTTGELRVSGPLADPGRLRLEASLPVLELRLLDYRVRNREPLELGAGEGRLEVRDVHLEGEGTDLAVEGSAELLRDGPVSLRVSGAADLRALAAVTRNLRGRGAARLRMEVTGTRDAPRVDGTLDLDGGGLRVRGFPHGVDDVQGTVRFSETAARFDGVTGQVGGGGVELEGGVTYAAGRLERFDITASGRDIRLRYPEGLRSQVDADIRFFGDPVTQWLTGSVDIRQALWTRRYDLASELLSGGGVPAAVTDESLAGSHLRYELAVRAPGTLRIDNNLATLEASADLRLQGTYASPVVVGRAEVERGRVYFQGNTYTIRRGIIDFVNPERIDPLFDIEAETRLRSYRVTLRANGTLERVSPTLTSDPPLSSVQILSLLAGAQDVSSLAQAQAGQANLAATGAATLAAGALSEEVGLERGAERLFGLNRFSIDPSVLKGGVTNPTARLTVGKRLTSNLSVLYSQDLRGTEDRLISVEYTLSDRVSVLVTQSPTEKLAFDVRLQRSY